LNRILEKLTSGRWLLTITACFVWAICTWHGTFDGPVNSGLLVLVIKEYFDRKDRGANP
jgi:hypothetical protein